MPESSDLISGRLPTTPAGLQQPLPGDQTDRPITVSRSCVKPKVWRDVDSTRRQFGIVVRPAGLSLYLGKRLYRALWMQA